MKKRKLLRENIPARDDFYLALAMVGTAACKGPELAGAVILSANGREHTLAWDSLPSLLVESSCGWDDNLVMHAEVSAITKTRWNVDGGSLFVTRYPCLNCVKHAFSEGIKRIVYLPVGTKENWEEIVELNRLLYGQLEEFKGNLNWLRDHVKWMEAHDLFKNRASI